MENQSAQPESVSLTEFALRLRVSVQAVSKAVRKHRLKRSIGRDGNDRPFIRDYALACQEWRENSSRPVWLPPLPAAGGAAPVAAAEAVHASAQSDDSESAPVTSGGATLGDAQRDAMVERARKLRMENDLQAGQLIKAEEAAALAFEFSRILRDQLLNMPARLAAQLVQLAQEADEKRVFALLAEGVREVLNATADSMERNGAAVASAAGAVRGGK